MTIPSEQYELLAEIQRELSRARKPRDVEIIADRYRQRLELCAASIQASAKQAKGDAVRRVKL